jgi:hypothetical protein
MSRAPPRSPQKPQTQPRTPVAGSSRSRNGSPLTVGPSTPRARTKSIPKTPTERATIRTPDDRSVPPAKLNLSIREAIALKRAEAKKVPKVAGENLESLEDALPATGNNKGDEEVFDLGRWSVRETIERARSTGDHSNIVEPRSPPLMPWLKGSLNLSSRSLPCIPSALFEIHLGITPDPLKSVTTEPPIGAPSDQSKRGAKRNAPSWFEAQDLHILKAWNNDIVEIQHEISLFGSLKIVDVSQLIQVLIQFW